MSSEEENIEIKQKIISHIKQTFPEEQKNSAINQIESMSSEQLENFLEKNNMINNEESPECVFCAIASDKIHSVKLGENEDAVAVLEINPISKGHTLIIPLEHSETASKKSLTLAEKISKKLKEKLGVKEVKISKSKLFGHEIINLLPVYENEIFNSKKNSVKTEELERIKEEIEREEEKKDKEPKSKIEEIKEFFRLPKRIP